MNTPQPNESQMCWLILTARNAGLIATQQNLQKNPGVYPSMALTSELNLFTPEKRNTTDRLLFVSSNRIPNFICGYVP